MDISQRLLRLMRSIAEDRFETITRFIEEGGDFLDERLRAWEEKLNIDPEGAAGEKQRSDRYEEENRDRHTRFQQADPTDQLTEDLQLFGLKPPSSLEEVRQIRNRELKKFHPDKYLDQPDKLETAKQIVQIYNTTYDRLKQYYLRRN